MLPAPRLAGASRHRRGMAVGAQRHISHIESAVCDGSTPPEPLAQGVGMVGGSIPKATAYKGSLPLVSQTGRPEVPRVAPPVSPSCRPHAERLWASARFFARGRLLHGAARSDRRLSRPPNRRACRPDTGAARRAARAPRPLLRPAPTHPRAAPALFFAGAVCLPARAHPPAAGCL